MAQLFICRFAVDSSKADDRMLFALLLAFAAPAWSLVIEVLSTFSFVRHGDRTPIILGDPVLTTLGAEQLYDAGSSFRTRYITSGSLRDISATVLVNTDLNILTLDHQSDAASAQAFMQGLYPPIGNVSSNNSSSNGVIQSQLADGTIVAAPLNGAQFANVRVASSNDFASIWVDGTVSCPAYETLMNDFYNTSTYQQLVANSSTFYEAIDPEFLSSAFPDETVGFFNAYPIWEYLSYGYQHNRTVANTLSTANLTKARLYADNYVFHMYGNTSTPSGVGPDKIRAIAGRTLLYYMTLLFDGNINSEGQFYKMNLVFGDFEPMVSLAAVVGLISERQQTFYEIPAPGSSMTFELVSLVNDNATGADYYSPANLFVRFSYRNGTSEYSPYRDIALFGHSPSQDMIPLSEFRRGVEALAIHGVKDWCNTCGSQSVFCPAYTGKTSGGIPLASRIQRPSISPAIAGVIGALVTLVFATTVAGLVMLLAGIRLHRVHHRRRSELGGFKGAEKLASDQDLTLPKGGAGAVVTESVPEDPKGHERTGSWELRNQAKEVGAGTGVNKPSRGRRASFEDDEIFAVPVHPHDRV